jgi:hypothetical protein
MRALIEMLVKFRRRQIGSLARAPAQHSLRIAPSGLQTSYSNLYPGRRGLGRERPEPALPWAVLGEAFSLAGGLEPIGKIEFEAHQSKRSRLINFSCVSRVFAPAPGSAVQFGSLTHAVPRRPEGSI